VAEELRASEQRYRYLFENANDAIFVHDLQGKIVAANQACERLTGYPVEELMGANMATLLSSEELSTAGRVQQRLLVGEEVSPYEQQFSRKDGTTAIVKLATSLITNNSQPTGFHHIARDITDEKRAQENLHYYVQQITSAQEEERKRIAREIHDDAAQSVLVLSRRLDALVSKPGRRLSPVLREDLKDLQGLSDDILQSLRRFAQNLRPRILDDLGLVAAVEWLAEDLSQSEGIDARVDVQGDASDISPETQLLLFRIVQEALSNVRRHAQASKVVIKLDFTPEQIAMMVYDNGKGFELPEMISDFASSGRLGLAGMQERGRLLGGVISVQSAPGKGTTITVQVPRESPF